MERLFSACPSCGARNIGFERLPTGGAREICMNCMFVANYVQFTCGCCNPDVFAICPKKSCRRTPRGTPTKQLCNGP
jgi:hypothetical protein